MRPEAVDILLGSLRFLQKEKQVMIFGYVIMENHLHLIAKSHDLSAHLQQFKSYTATQILDLLKRRCATRLLDQFRFHKKRHKKESTHQFWEDGNHPQQIDTDKMMLQKLEYSHNNPVRRGYVDDPICWRYSSARNYAGQPGLIDIVTEW
jgi:REP element-mobilizing transposase RayT